MKLRFLPHQDYQLKAVKAVVQLFEGQTLSGEYADSTHFSEKGVANRLEISREQILHNLRQVQLQRGITPDREIIPASAGTAVNRDVPLNFTVEMETGTGKTYTYLRTIYELHHWYGFKKFVIVVPGIAIREGTLKNLDITHAHFQQLYGNPKVHYGVYNRRNLNGLRNFAHASALSILVVNIESFARDQNVMNTLQETGMRPVEYIQATHPVVIMDEAQNFETDTRRRAIARLNPLCTLRFSATHRYLYNLVYRLNPAQAYELGLVKHIEVDGIAADHQGYPPFIHLYGLQKTGNSVIARMGIYALVNHKERPVQVFLRKGENLVERSGGLRRYRNNFVLQNIDNEGNTVIFANGVKLQAGQTYGGSQDAVMRYQIERTVYWHLKKTRALQNRGIKVLSLIFIDRVANYRTYDAAGHAQKGKFALWLEEAYRQLAALPEFKGLLPFQPEQLHDGYFSADPVGKGAAQKMQWTDTKGNLKKDYETYSLIMRDKERLLSPEEPLQFIFSHSALREGWDNPNVFQICTLNESRSELRKRQEIGRGLRLPVNTNGERVRDKRVNILTVVANETYDHFARALQHEIEQETQVGFAGKIRNARSRVQIEPNAPLTRDENPLFFQLWDQISVQASYSVVINTQELIREAAKALKAMPDIHPPEFEDFQRELLHDLAIPNDSAHPETKKQEFATRPQIPEVYRYMQNHLALTRNTIYQILMQSGRIRGLAINPQHFLEEAVARIRQVVYRLQVEGVQYHLIHKGCNEPSPQLFGASEAYRSQVFQVSRPEKTLFNYIPVQNEKERRFAESCEQDPQVAYFFQWPRGISLPTPLGPYVPGWAVLYQGAGVYAFIADIPAAKSQSRHTSTHNLQQQCMQRLAGQVLPQNVHYGTGISPAAIYQKMG